MSLLSKIGGKIGHVVSTNVRGLGRTNEQLLKAVGPAVGLIPGVGPLVNAGLNASASVMAGHNLKHTAGAAAKGALVGGVGKLLGSLGGAVKAIPGAANLPGVEAIGGIANKVKGAVSSIPGVDKLGGIVNTVKAGARAVNGGKAITLGSLGDALKGGVGAIASHPELAAAGLSAYSGYKDSQRASQLENDSIDTLRNAYLALDPNKPREDMTSLYADPGNPYNKAKKIRLQTA